MGRRMGAQGGPGLLHGLLGAGFGAPPLQGQVCLVCSWKVTGTGLLFQHTWTGWARDKMGTQWSLFLAHGPGSALAVIPFLEPSMSRDDAPKGGALLLPGSKSLFSVPVGLDAMGVWVPSLCPPGWGSWCECSELGSSLHHTGLLWRLEGDPDSSHSLAESPQGWSHWHCRKGDLEKCGVFQTLCSVPAVRAQQWLIRTSQYLGSGCRAAAPTALPTQGTFPAGSVSGCRSFSSPELDLSATSRAGP